VISRWLEAVSQIRSLPEIWLGLPIVVVLAVAATELDLPVSGYLVWRIGATFIGAIALSRVIRRSPPAKRTALQGSERRGWRIGLIVGALLIVLALVQTLVNSR